MEAFAAVADLLDVFPDIINEEQIEEGMEQFIRSVGIDTVKACDGGV